MKIAIFCSSQHSQSDTYKSTAKELAQQLAKHNIGIIYGGASIGIMNIFADEALKSGGEVIGVIPRFMQKHEIAHSGLTELHWVESMQERKQLIADLADEFIIYPGGIGTLDEFFEVWTWRKLGMHDKPIKLFNVNGYYDHLLKFINEMKVEKFIKQPALDKIEICHSIEECLPSSIIENL